MNDKTLKKIAKEIVRAQKDAQLARRAANIAHFHRCHDEWRSAVGLPPLIRDRAGRVLGVFKMEARRG